MAPFFRVARSCHFREVAFDPARLNRMEFMRLVTPAGIQRTVSPPESRPPPGIPRFCRCTKVQSLFVPLDKHTDAAADQPHVLDDHMYEIGKEPIAAWLDCRQNLQHLLRTAQTAADCKAKGFRPDEQQIQQRFLCLNRTRKRSSDRYRLLKDFAIRMIGKSVQNQRVPDEELLPLLTTGLPALAQLLQWMTDGVALR
jgi:hypothetical protein